MSGPKCRGWSGVEKDIENVVEISKSDETLQIYTSSRLIVVVENGQSVGPLPITWINKIKNRTFSVHQTLESEEKTIRIEIGGNVPGVVDEGDVVLKRFVFWNR